MCTYFKLQRCVAATGRQWGHRGVHKAIEQQWATGVVEQRKEGILWEGWCDGRQWAEQVVRGCLCLCYVLGTTLLKRCSQFYYFKHEIGKKKKSRKVVKMIWSSWDPLFTPRVFHILLNKTSLHCLLIYIITSWIQSKLNNYMVFFQLPVQRIMLWRWMSHSNGGDIYTPLDRGLGVDLLLVLCWEEVDSVPSSTLAEQLSSSTCLIHLCIKTQWSLALYCWL